MKIKVMPRNECVRYCHKPHNESSIIVSINTPWAAYDSAPFGNEENKVISILRLWFDDVDEKITNCMNEDHAKAIKDFVDRYADYDVTVIVHCDAGVSRSAGVAAALSEYYNGDDSYFFDSGYYTPNMLCYRAMMDELHG